MRESAFWARMVERFGEQYARSVAADHVLAALDGRTAAEAMAAGVEPKSVWLAVCEAFPVRSGARR